MLSNIIKITKANLLLLQVNAGLGGDYMIPVCRNEILACPAGTDFILRLHGESNFISARQDSFPTSICLEMFTFSFNFPLLARVHSA